MLVVDIAGLVQRLSRPLNLNPSIVATAVKDFEVKDTLERLAGPEQARDGLLHAFGHRICWVGIHNGANM